MDAPVVVLMFLGTECPLSKLHAVRLVDLVDRLDAQRTSEVFVLDQRRQIRYRRRIDDRYGVGYAHRQAECSDLRAALDEPIAAGRTVKVPVTEAVGCLIGRKPDRQPDAPVNYTAQTALPLNKHCVKFHRAGEIYPFSLFD